MTVLIALAVALRLSSAAPVPPLAHVTAAVDAAGADLPVEIVLAIAWYESGYTVPLDAEPWHCGPMQVEAAPATCMRYRDLETGYAAGADILRAWLRAAGGRWRSALCGYRWGWAGLRGDCPDRYDERVLALAARYGWRP